MKDTTGKTISYIIILVLICIALCNAGKVNGQSPWIWKWGKPHTPNSGLRQRIYGYRPTRPAPGTAGGRRERVLLHRGAIQERPVRVSKRVGYRYRRYNTAHRVLTFS